MNELQNIYKNDMKFCNAKQDLTEEFKKANLN